MPTQVQTKILRAEKRAAQNAEISSATQTVIGWQGVRCMLPPDWNVTGFSMDRENGYLRVDAPAPGTMTVQIRWSNAARVQKGPPNLYTFLAPRFRKLFKRPDAAVPKPDLKANLEKILKETAKQAKKAKAGFESTIKPEKTEGDDDERTAINFSWNGGGRGQGKIWYCAVCHRIIVAQVVGMPKDQTAMALIASQLFATLHDHSIDGYDRWALYDLQVDVPDDFHLEDQKLLSGYLHLGFRRGSERILVDRWGLANVTLKKFTLDAWFRNHALVKLKRLPKDERSLHGHECEHYTGSIPAIARIRALRETKGALRRFATRYESGIWECPNTNKLYAIQVAHNKRSVGLWEEVAERCDCH